MAPLLWRVGLAKRVCRLIDGRNPPERLVRWRDLVAIRTKITSGFLRGDSKDVLSHAHPSLHEGRGTALTTSQRGAPMLLASAVH